MLLIKTWYNCPNHFRSRFCSERSLLRESPLKFTFMFLDLKILNFNVHWKIVPLNMLS